MYVGPRHNLTDWSVAIIICLTYVKISKVNLISSKFFILFYLFYYYLFIFESVCWMSEGEKSGRCKCIERRKTLKADLYLHYSLVQRDGFFSITIRFPLYLTQWSHMNTKTTWFRKHLSLFFAVSVTVDFHRTIGANIRYSPWVASVSTCGTFLMLQQVNTTLTFLLFFFFSTIIQKYIYKFCRGMRILAC